MDSGGVQHIFIVEINDGETEMQIPVHPDPAIARQQEADWLASADVTSVSRGRTLSAPPIADDEERALGQPRILVVDATAPAAYRSISEAVAEAHAGDRVLVRPGRWHESVFLGKSITIEGDGEAGAVVIEGLDAVTVTVSSDDAHLSGMTLIGRSASAERTDSILLLTGDAHVERLVVRDGEGVGIRVERGASPNVDACEVLNCYIGVGISGGSNPLVRHNNVSGHQIAGIYVGEGSSPTIEENRVSACQQSGIYVNGLGANPLIRSNAVRDAGTVGFQVHGRASPIIDGNTVSGNTKNGVLVYEQGTDPVIRANTFRDGQSSGVLVHGGASPIIEANDVSGYSRIGMQVYEPGTDPVIRGNTVRDGQATGVDVYGGASPTMEANEILGNAMMGITIDGTGTAPTIRGNTVRNSGQFGIYVLGGAMPIVAGNSLDGNASGGIYVENDGSSPQIGDNPGA